MFSRIGGEWLGRVFDATAVLDMPEIGIAVPVAELYEGISFGEQPTAA